MSLLSPGFNTGTYTVTRSTPGAVTLGRPAAPTTTTLPIAASIQPLTGRALKDLPEGKRAEDYRWVFTETRLYALDPVANVLEDMIDIPGEGTFRVNEVEYFGVISKHYRAKIERVSVP